MARVSVCLESEPDWHWARGVNRVQQNRKSARKHSVILWLVSRNFRTNHGAGKLNSPSGSGAEWANTNTEEPRHFDAKL